MKPFSLSNNQEGRRLGQVCPAEQGAVLCSPSSLDAVLSEAVLAAITKHSCAGGEDAVPTLRPTSVQEDNNVECPACCPTDDSTLLTWLEYLLGDKQLAKTNLYHMYPIIILI